MGLKYMIVKSAVIINLDLPILVPEVCNKWNSGTFSGYLGHGFWALGLGFGFRA